MDQYWSELLIVGVAGLEYILITGSEMIQREEECFPLSAKHAKHWYSRCCPVGYDYSWPRKIYYDWRITLKPIVFVQFLVSFIYHM